MATTTTVPSVHRWRDVPDGSQLVIKTTATPPNVRITINMLEDDSTITKFASSKIVNKSLTIPIVSPRLYTMAVTIEFVGAATTLKFDARILRQDGAMHSSPLLFEAKRPPAVQHLQVSVFTVVQS